MTFIAKLYVARLQMIYLDFQQRQNESFQSEMSFHFEMGYKIIARLNPQVPI